jgi:hypothetical protein
MRGFGFRPGGEMFRGRARGETIGFSNGPKGKFSPGWGGPNQKVPPGGRYFRGTAPGRKPFYIRTVSGQKEETMADREIIHTSDGGGSGMGAILGMILGVLLVGGLIFFFAGDWDGGGDKVTINAPSAPATTGSTPAKPAR